MAAGGHHVDAAIVLVAIGGIGQVDGGDARRVGIAYRSEHGHASAARRIAAHQYVVGAAGHVVEDVARLEGSATVDAVRQVIGGVDGQDRQLSIGGGTAAYLGVEHHIDDRDLPLIYNDHVGGSDRTGAVGIAHTGLINARRKPGEGAAVGHVGLAAVDAIFEAALSTGSGDEHTAGGDIAAGRIERRDLSDRGRTRPREGNGAAVHGAATVGVANHDVVHPTIQADEETARRESLAAVDTVLERLRRAGGHDADVAILIGTVGGVINDDVADNGTIRSGEHDRGSGRGALAVGITHNGRVGAAGQALKEAGALEGHAAVNAVFEGRIPGRFNFERPVGEGAATRWGQHHVIDHRIGGYGQREGRTGGGANAVFVAHFHLIYPGIEAGKDIIGLERGSAVDTVFVSAITTLRRDTDEGLTGTSAPVGGADARNTQIASDDGKTGHIVVVLVDGAIVADEVVHHEVVIGIIVERAVAIRNGITVHVLGAENFGHVEIHAGGHVGLHEKLDLDRRFFAGPQRTGDGIDGVIAHGGPDVVETGGIGQEVSYHDILHRGIALVEDLDGEDDRFARRNGGLIRRFAQGQIVGLGG